MRNIFVSVLLLACVSAGYAQQKQYVAGTMMSIEPSHSQTFNKGTSIDNYYIGYSVQIGNMIYSAWCSERLLSSCDTDFVINAPVQVRLDHSHLYLVRSNGKEQKMTIGRKELAPTTRPTSN